MRCYHTDYTKSCKRDVKDEWICKLSTITITVSCKVPMTMMMTEAACIIKTFTKSHLVAHRRDRQKLVNR